MELTQSANERLQQLLDKCIENDIRFEYIPSAPSLIVAFGDEVLASIWLDGKDVLKKINWMNHKVDEFIKEESIVNESITRSVSKSAI